MNLMNLVKVINGFKYLKSMSNSRLGMAGWVEVIPPVCGTEAAGGDGSGGANLHVLPQNCFGSTCKMLKHAVSQASALVNTCVKISAAIVAVGSLIKFV